MKTSLLLLASLFATATISRAADEPLVPFVLPWDDAGPGITNVSNLLDKPAGGRGFVVVKEGHLYEGGKRFRIFGVNTAFGANFPTHDDAEKVAARMAKFGINCVRFHHMDNQHAPGGIWSADMKTLDPAQLDKLDYFIAQLKKNGVYADLNLHVSREYPDMPRWERMPGYFKGVDIFYPPMIGMQREYARNLLTHVNPYTKTAYIDEPAVALIEINNENGLICEWWSGSLDAMADVYQAELTKRWNQWLATRYSSRDALQKAWAVSEQPLGAEKLKETSFEKGTGAGTTWGVEQHEGAKAVVSQADGGLLVAVQQLGREPWHVQLEQNKLSFSKENHYTVSFRARADGPRRITVGISQSHAPWDQLWSANARLTDKWQDFRFTFQPEKGEDEARLLSNLGAAKGNYWIANVSLRPGGVLGLQESEQPGTLPLFKKSEGEQRTAAARTDWMRFLYDTETNYWADMERFLKEDLKAHSLVVGTATGFSPPSIQAKLDIVDVHAYWQHPHFPHKAWDHKDWVVNNIPMAGEPDGGTLPGLVQRRVAGKPYICTEYNAAAPNTYSSEAFLLANAYAALQDWDGLFVFAYSHRHDDWDSQRICSFFDLDQHPSKMATLPAAVSLFLRRDVSKAKNTVTIPVPWDTAIEKSVRWGPWWEMKSFGASKQDSLLSLMQFDTNAKGPVAPTEAAPEKTTGPARSIVSDTGELTWGADKGIVTINTPRSKAFIGKITGEAIQLGDVTIEPHMNLQNWAAITVTAMDDRDLKSSGRILITATGLAENTGMRWTDAKKNTLIDGNWGTAPSLVEVIPAKITLPFPAGSVKAWALDGRGRRGGELSIGQSGGNAVIEIGAPAHTLWYEVEAAGSGAR